MGFSTAAGYCYYVFTPFQADSLVFFPQFGTALEVAQCHCKSRFGNVRSVGEYISFPFYRVDYYAVMASSRRFVEVDYYAVLTECRR